MSGFFNMDSPVMRFLSRVCDLMILNFMCLICCIPIVTIGASVTALYSVTLKMVRGEESYIFKGFLKAFKENFKISTIIWLLLAVLGLLIFADYKATQFLPDNMKNIFRILVGVVITFYLLLMTYVFPYVARFENNVKNTLKNALLISILEPAPYGSGCLYSGGNRVHHHVQLHHTGLRKPVLVPDRTFLYRLLQLLHIPQGLCKV